MDRLTTFGVICAACAAVILGYLVHKNRQLRFRRLMKGPLEEYFAGQMEIGQLGRLARETVARSFLGGNEFFAEAAAAFQHAVDAARAKKSSPQDEDKLMRLLASLRNEFGL